MKELAANLRPTIPPAFKWYVTLLPTHGIFAEGSTHLTETRPKSGRGLTVYPSDV
jgi:hypothetical protein